MPTAKPRLMFSLDPAVAADLATIARFRGVAVSRVVADAIADLAPAFRQHVVAIEFIERADAKAAELAGKYTGELQRKFAPHVGLVEKATREAEAALQRIEATRPRPRTAQNGVQGSRPLR